MHRQQRVDAERRLAPSRFQSQSDAVNLLAGARTGAHPENTVGILTMAGKTPRVLVTPTPDLGKVLHCMHDVDVDGECNVATAVQIAQLCLKHRQNKNQRQRVVIFSGSPVSEDKVLSPPPRISIRLYVPLGRLQSHGAPLPDQGMHAQIWQPRLPNAAASETLALSIM